jgi:hypothetical protein
MWVLIISLYLPQPLGHVQSRGVIEAPQPSYEACQRERDRVRSTWFIDGYRISPRCIYVKYYQ